MLSRVDPFAVGRLAAGIILWCVALRLQDAAELMAGGASFTQAVAVDTFGPVLLVAALLWRAGLLSAQRLGQSAGVTVAATAGLGLVGVAATGPLLQAVLVDLPVRLASGLA